VATHKNAMPMFGSHGNTSLPSIGGGSLIGYVHFCYV